MKQGLVEQMLQILNQDVSVEPADTPSALWEAYRLRHQVYVVERAYEIGDNGTEWDEYDNFARHVIVRWRRTSHVVGTVRLILPKNSTSCDNFPLQRVCDPGVLRMLPRATTGEISRFALAKQMTQQMRSAGVETTSVLRLALMRGAIFMCVQLGLTHFIAMMEPTLLHLLRADGIYFHSLGPLVDYHGLRQFVVAALGTMTERLSMENPAAWNYITDSGALCPALLSQSHRDLVARS